MPQGVFFRGQTAAIQSRNSAGLRLDHGQLVLAAMVDTSGYSSGIAQRYQAYLITEVPLRFEAQVLPPGAYGFGFVDGERMVVMDLGGAEILHGKTIRDPALSRPRPLQIVADGSVPGGYRLYLGRNYVSLVAVQPPAH